MSERWIVEGYPDEVFPDELSAAARAWERAGPGVISRPRVLQMTSSTSRPRRTGITADRWVIERMKDSRITKKSFRESHIGDLYVQTLTNNSAVPLDTDTATIEYEPIGMRMRALNEEIGARLTVGTRVPSESDRFHGDQYRLSATAPEQYIWDAFRGVWSEYSYSSPTKKTIVHFPMSSRSTPEILLYYCDIIGILCVPDYDKRRDMVIIPDIDDEQFDVLGTFPAMDTSTVMQIGSLVRSSRVHLSVKHSLERSMIGSRLRVSGDDMAEVLMYRREPAGGGIRAGE